ncbi:MAG: hypothetical protein H0X16_04785 [Chloroflexi bacterium]|nr:hypothetical protein [Chloroflexota bacterium]
MQKSVAAIHSAGSRTRFVRYSPRQRERRLGLHRVASLQALGTRAQAGPVRRGLARSLLRLDRAVVTGMRSTRPEGMTARQLRRPERMAWSAMPSRTLHRAAAGNSAPWRA